MSILIVLIAAIPLTTALAIVWAERHSASRLIMGVGMAWLCLVPLVLVLNSWLPFATGGDDVGYFAIADPPVRNLAEVFDLGRYGGIEQPGYPWLLSTVNGLIGYDLAAFKLLNLAWLILVAIVWYRVGDVLEGGLFARRLIVAILLLTPLWYYVFFLLKDMSIVLLQSIFVLALVQLRASRILAPAATLVAVAFPLALFRSPLILIDAAVLLGTLVLAAWAVRGRRTGVLAAGLVMVLLLAGGALFTDYDFMSGLGLFEDHRVVSAAMLDVRLDAATKAESRGLLFVPIYFLVDVAGLNPATWSELDAEWLRGVLTIPWILMGPPFVLLGISHCFRDPSGGQHSGRWIATLRNSRAISSPWSAVLLFVASSFVVSWVVGDSTRWRVADLPGLAALAVLGWTSTTPTVRRNVLLSWCACVAAYSILVAARSA